MPEARIELVAGADVALEYAARNIDVYDAFLEVNELGDMRADAVVSVMEPATLISLKPRAQRSIYIDSLYSFWSWDPLETKQMDRRLHAAADGDWSRLLQGATPHMRQFIGHCAADVSFVQVPPRRRRGYSSHRVVEVPPILPPLPRCAPKCDTVLVSLCGHRAPGIERGYLARYAEFVTRAVLPAVERVGAERVHIAGDPSLLGLPASRRGEWTVGYLPRAEYLAILAQARLLICPSSLTSIFEAIALEVPVVLLPEQNTSHMPNKTSMTSCMVSSFSGWSLSGIDPAVSAVSESDIRIIYEALARVLSSADLMQGVSESYLRAIKRVAADYGAVTRRQRDEAGLGACCEASGVDRIVEGLLEC